MKSLPTVKEQLYFKKALNMDIRGLKLGILWVYNGVVCITDVEIVSILVWLGSSELLRIYLQVSIRRDLTVLEKFSSI